MGPDGGEGCLMIPAVLGAERGSRSCCCGAGGCRRRWEGGKVGGQGGWVGGRGGREKHAGGWEAGVGGGKCGRRGGKFSISVIAVSGGFPS